MKTRTTALLLWAMTVLALLTLPFAAAQAATGGKRLALVIGNSNYESVYSLKNAGSDSVSVARTLEALGFEVTLLSDATLAEMDAAIEDVALRAEDGAEATLVYYSGHGFQLRGANYVVPVDAVLDDREKIDERTIRLDDIIARLAAEDRQTILLLDACRDNPLPASVRGSDSSNGLAEVQSADNVYIAFATAAGGVTSDGAGDSGPFAAALVDNMLVPDLSISDMMINVRNSVRAATNGVQRPFTSDSLLTQFYFNPGDFEGGVNFADAGGVEFEGGVEFGTLAPVPVSGTQTAQQDIPLIDIGGTPATPEVPDMVVADITEQGALARGLDQTPAVPQPTIGLAPEPEFVAQPPAQPTLAPLGEGDTTQTAALAPQVLTPSTRVDGVVEGVEIFEEEPIEAEPVDYASLVQEHLKRVGCYSGAIDGDFGRGSRSALQRYFDSKDIRSDETDPTEAVLARLTDETGIICKAAPVVAQQPAAPKTTTVKKAAPANNTVAAKPAAEPAAPIKKNKLSVGGAGVFR